MIPRAHYHAVQFYKSAQSSAATVARFLSNGIRADEPALVVATATHASALLIALQKAGHNVDDLKKAGALQVFDARKMLSLFMVGGRPDPLMFASNFGDIIDRASIGRGPNRVRVYGEMVDLLWQDDNPDGAIRLEVLWNQLGSAYRLFSPLRLLSCALLQITT